MKINELVLTACSGAKSIRDLLNQSKFKFTEKNTISNGSHAVEFRIVVTANSKKYTKLVADLKKINYTV